MSCLQCCQDQCKLFDLQNKCSQIKTVSLCQQWFSSNVLSAASTEALCKLDIWEGVETREAGGDLPFLYKFYPSSPYKPHPCWILADTEVPQKANLMERVCHTDHACIICPEMATAKSNQIFFLLIFEGNKYPSFPSHLCFLKKEIRRGEEKKQQQKKETLVGGLVVALNIFVIPRAGLREPQQSRSWVWGFPRKQD